MLKFCPGANFSAAKSRWCHIVLMPNCSSAYCLVLNYPGVKLSLCQIALVTNCPGSKLAGVKVSWCQIVWWQIVLVPNCPGDKLSWYQIFWCFIVIVSNWLLPNCPVSIFPVAKMYGAKLCASKFPCYRLWLARQTWSTYFFTQLIFCIFLLLIQICNILPCHTS